MSRRSMLTTTVAAIADLLNQQRLRKGEVAYLFALLRVLVEEDSAKDRFPHVCFYGDWSVHARLSRSDLCVSILEDLTDLFLRATQTGFSDGEIHRRINAIIGVSDLRTEAIELLNAKGLPIRAFTHDQNWKGIFTLLSQTLIDRPIEYPTPISKRARVVYDRCELKCHGSDFLIRRFEFANLRGVLHWRILARNDFIDIVGMIVFP